MSPEGEVNQKRIDRNPVAAYNKNMRWFLFFLRMQGWMTNAHATVLAALLAVPGSGVVCQVHALLNRASERPSVVASWHPTSDPLDAAHLRLASSCHEDYEDRLKTQHRTPQFSKSWHAAVPLQTSSGCGAGASQANIASPVVAGPAPPFLSSSPSRAPPLAPSRA